MKAEIIELLVAMKGHSFQSKEIENAYNKVCESIKANSWKNLTNEEHMQIAIDYGCADVEWIFYGAAVERKVKEKNTQ